VYLIEIDKILISLIRASQRTTYEYSSAIDRYLYFNDSLIVESYEYRLKNNFEFMSTSTSTAKRFSRLRDKITEWRQAFLRLICDLVLLLQWILIQWGLPTVQLTSRLIIIGLSPSLSLSLLLSLILSLSLFLYL
jgi:hypothetical protein